MVLHVALYLALVLSGIALVALVLLRDADEERGAESPIALQRAWSWSAGLFLASAAGLMLATDGSTGSLLAGAAVLGAEADEAPEAVEETVIGAGRAPRSAEDVSGDEFEGDLR